MAGLDSPAHARLACQGPGLRLLCTVAHHPDSLELTEVPSGAGRAPGAGGSKPAP